MNYAVQYCSKVFDHLVWFCLGRIAALICGFTSVKPRLTAMKTAVYPRFFPVDLSRDKNRTRLGLNRLLFALFSSVLSDYKKTAGLRYYKFCMTIFGRSLNWKLTLRSEITVN